MPRIFATVFATAAALLAVSCADSGRQRLPAGTIFNINDSTMLHGAADTLLLGHMYQGEVVQKDFYIRNSTEEPIVILGCEISCGCTQMIYDDAPIAPGEYRKVTCRFDSAGEYGWSLTVVSFNLSGTDKRHRLLVDSEVGIR